VTDFWQVLEDLFKQVRGHKVAASHNKEKDNDAVSFR
jgi:hypothetical protein